MHRQKRCIQGPSGVPVNHSRPPMKGIESVLRDARVNAGVLLLAAFVAMGVANSGWSEAYLGLIHQPLAIGMDGIQLEKSLLLWINDGLMSIFFLLIGLEIKREFLFGALRDRRQLTLPCLGALGGMILPAFVYWCINWNDPMALSGWAIPVATDVAFALGVLALLGERIPKALRLFLVALAIFDDLGAILIIALVYGHGLSIPAMLAVAVCILTLILMNRLGVNRLALYLAVGLLMWLAVLKSGVHASIAGVLLALFIPAKGHASPLAVLERRLTIPVAWLILPLFAFANAGVPLKALPADSWFHPVPLGVMLGLFLGKQLGVMLFCWTGVRFGLTKLPQGVTWHMMHGVAMLTGIGFTMSLFIGSLAFEETGIDFVFDERLGILAGSLLSAIFGGLRLWLLGKSAFRC